MKTVLDCEAFLPHWSAHCQLSSTKEIKEHVFQLDPLSTFLCAYYSW